MKEIKAPKNYVVATSSPNAPMQFISETNSEELSQATRFTILEASRQALMANKDLGYMKSPQRVGVFNVVNVGVTETL